MVSPEIMKLAQESFEAHVRKEREEARREALGEAAQKVRTAYPKIGHETFRNAMSDAILDLMNEDTDR